MSSNIAMGGAPNEDTPSIDLNRLENGNYYMPMISMENIVSKKFTILRK